MPHDSTAQAAPERADGLMTGFPPAPEAQVTLANWQDPPFNRWAFRHMRELIPSQPIPAYRSADSDMLGWVCERASGTRMADLISALIWQPMGAERDGEITCDPLGSAIHDGGVSATARDLARFGQLLVADGYARGGAGGLGGGQG